MNLSAENPPCSSGADDGDAEDAALLGAAGAGRPRRVLWSRVADANGNLLAFVKPQGGNHVCIKQANCPF